MPIIKFLLPNDNHMIKKLLLVFWEIWPKTDSEGKLDPRMILVCDAYRKVCFLIIKILNNSYSYLFNKLCVFLFSIKNGKKVWLYLYS